ncbi:MAG: hypothetical protein ACLU5J_12715 [Christensenellales bacterium]
MDSLELNKVFIFPEPINELLESDIPNEVPEPINVFSDLIILLDSPEIIEDLLEELIEQVLPEPIKEYVLSIVLF